MSPTESISEQNRHTGGGDETMTTDEMVVDVFEITERLT
jgi:hypothetical protein